MLEINVENELKSGKLLIIFRRNFIDFKVIKVLKENVWSWFRNKQL